MLQNELMTHTISVWPAAGGGAGVARGGRGDAGHRGRRQRRGHDPARGRGRGHLRRGGAAGRVRLRLQHRAGTPASDVVLYKNKKSN